jgi:hypothetical protein
MARIVYANENCAIICVGESCDRPKQVIFGISYPCFVGGKPPFKLDILPSPSCIASFRLGTRIAVREK